MLYIEQVQNCSNFQNIYSQAYFEIVLYSILTHLAYIANAKKCAISNNNVTVLKVQGKPALADINSYSKMTTVMAFNRGCNVIFMLERRYKYF